MKSFLVILLASTLPSIIALVEAQCTLCVDGTELPGMSVELVVLLIIIAFAHLNNSWW